MIALENLSVRVGSFSLENISLEIPTGEHAFLMGKTGSGKTTLLEAICGLKQITSGRVFLMGQEVTRLKPALRGIGFVPQDGALFSTMTVREQLAFALAIRKWNRADMQSRVKELAAWLGLEPLLNRKPNGLSGGEIQRVALGRALAFRPDVLCLDEPLSALDEDTRIEMGNLLQTVREHTAVTILHISHNLSEARRHSDRIFRLKDGKIRMEHVRETRVAEV
ncbi:MAG: ABC transporter ATP-binding protein [Candidatus Omnitrophica bacterium]|nr:ABC transporter ATP-binding protein [Candidatus Omnitrophota bacterium]